MRIVVISDTHNRHKKIELPPADVLVHCGDMTGMGRESEIYPFVNWLNGLPHKHKVIISGNHDFCFQDAIKEQRIIPVLEDNVHYLENSSVTIDGVKFFGSPYTPPFGNWAFMAPEPELFQIFSAIPEDTDVLITHGAPRYILDKNAYGEHCGSMSLLTHVRNIRPKIHVFGHIHEHYGLEVPPLEFDSTGNTVRGTVFGNAAICDLSYNVVNKPLLFDIGPSGVVESIAVS